MLQYNPDWKGAGYKRIGVDPDIFKPYGFEMQQEFSYDEDIHFTRESWAGRIRAVRGIGASLDKEMQEQFNSEHVKMLQSKYAQEFDITHHVLINSFRKI